jgi:hypothetical protein
VSDKALFHNAGVNPTSRILKILGLACCALLCMACGQKGSLCMPEPTDGSKL